MLYAFDAPHEMRRHSYVQYLNMPGIHAWHLRHSPQAIKRFHRFIAVQYYSNEKAKEINYPDRRRDFRKQISILKTLQQLPEEDAKSPPKDFQRLSDLLENLWGIASESA